MEDDIAQRQFSLDDSKGPTERRQPSYHDSAQSGQNSRNPTPPTQPLPPQPQPPQQGPSKLTSMSGHNNSKQSRSIGFDLSNSVMKREGSSHSKVLFQPEVKIVSPSPDPDMHMTLNHTTSQGHGAKPHKGVRISVDMPADMAAAVADGTASAIRGSSRNVFGVTLQVPGSAAGTAWGDAGDGGPLSPGPGTRSTSDAGMTPKAGAAPPADSDSDDLDVAPSGCASLPTFMPDNPWYTRWWYLLIVCGLISAWYEPFAMAFLPSAGLEPYDDVWAILEYLTQAVFSAHIALTFFKVREASDGMGVITSVPEIAKDYLKGYFWLDLLVTFPFDWLALGAAGCMGAQDPATGRLACGYLGLFKMLKVGRLYHILSFFQLVEYRMWLSQMSLVLVRNFMYIFFSTHWAACLFYLVARMERFRTTSWVGRAQHRFMDQSVAGRYVYALYFSMGAFIGLGDSELYAASVEESLFMICMLAYSVVLMAYVLGTVNMLIVKSDKRNKQHRDRMTNLKAYGDINELPESLMTAMVEHLDLHHRTNQASDEQVLSVYPTTIRRKVLRHLYLHVLKQCALMKGCSGKFLDALLATGRVEMFLPKVQILAEGDLVSDLYIIMDGQAELTRGGAMPTWALAGGGGDQSFSLGRSALSRRQSRMFSQDGNSQDADQSKHGAEFSGQGHGTGSGGTSVLPLGSVSLMSQGPGSLGGRALVNTVHEGETFGEACFFTEASSPDNVWSDSVVRVMIVSRAAWEGLETQFPQQCRTVMENLRCVWEEAMKFELAAALDACQLDADVVDDINHYALGEGSITDMPPELFFKVRQLLSPSQFQKWETLVEVKAVTKAYCEKVDQLRVYEFLNACAAGDLEAVRLMLGQGLSCNSADYDKRTGLMLACHNGHMAVAAKLLEVGIDPSIKDNFGGTAMFEAVKQGHRDLVDLLLQHKCSLGVDGIMVAAQMCQCVYQGDLDQLELLLQAGADPDSADYDQRCALHIAAAEGNLPAVRLMVEIGNATVDFADRWNNTALDEASRVGATAVVEYLTPLMELAKQGRKRFGKGNGPPPAASALIGASLGNSLSNPSLGGLMTLASGSTSKAPMHVILEEGSEFDRTSVMQRASLPESDRASAMQLIALTEMPGEGSDGEEGAEEEGARAAHSHGRGHPMTNPCGQGSGGGSSGSSPPRLPRALSSTISLARSQLASQQGMGMRTGASTPVSVQMVSELLEEVQQMQEEGDPAGGGVSVSRARSLYGSSSGGPTGTAGSSRGLTVGSSSRRGSTTTRMEEMVTELLEEVQEVERGASR